jgi:integrase
VKLHLRAQAFGATEPDHFLLPADLSRHTRQDDPLHGLGYDVRHHQRSWRTAWCALRKSVSARIVERATREKRDLTRDERDTVEVFSRLRFHDLRHSCITLLLERGAPFAVVEAMAGHMTRAMTKHYMHISSKAARQAVELLDKRPAGSEFVDTFVDTPAPEPRPDAKMLN